MNNYQEVNLNEVKETLSEQTVNAPQRQTAYIAYMMVGSYFRSCQCESEMKEQNMKLHYLDMKKPKQERLEELVEKDFSTFFSSDLPALQELDSKVQFLEDGEDLMVCFLGRFGKLLVTITPKGEYIFIRKWRGKGKRTFLGSFRVREDRVPYVIHG